jgi:hypothetical protein
VFYEPFDFPIMAETKKLGLSTTTTPHRREELQAARTRLRVVRARRRPRGHPRPSKK